MRRATALQKLLGANIYELRREKEVNGTFKIVWGSRVTTVNIIHNRGHEYKHKYTYTTHSYKCTVHCLHKLGTIRLFFLNGLILVLPLHNEPN